ncbi:MAG: DUF2760 domain-containing protein [Candidatus Riflebacteria bacterium]|nr:DUF2760 domain-containing protein [Candidatus Riflebacteria bacterium]
MRIFKAIGAFFRVLTDREFANQLSSLDRQMMSASLAVLTAMQREGRMVDFLLENIDAYDDAQVGAACRSIHQNCQKVIKDLVEVAPVRDEREGSKVTVEEGFDPSAIRLVGKVSGDPPFKGILRHHGWMAKAVHLTPPQAEQDPAVITPAEVELK